MSSSSCTSDVVRDRGLPSKCVCGLDVTIFTAKTQENPGRPFFRCSCKRDPRSWNTERDGHLFKWVEDAVLEEVEDALPRVAIMANEISKVKAEANELKAEANELKAVIEELKEETMVGKMEIRMLKVLLKVCFIWLCLITIVIVYLWFRQATKKNIQSVVGY